MKAVIAIDSFKGSLTSLEAGKSAADGCRMCHPSPGRRRRRNGRCPDHCLRRKSHRNFRNRPLRQPGHLPLWSDHTNTDRHY